MQEIITAGGLLLAAVAAWQEDASSRDVNRAMAKFVAIACLTLTLSAVVAL